MGGSTLWGEVGLWGQPPRAQCLAHSPVDPSDPGQGAGHFWACFAPKSGVGGGESSRRGVLLREEAPGFRLLPTGTTQGAPERSGPGPRSVILLGLSGRGEGLSVTDEPLRSERPSDERRREEKLGK